MSWVAGVVSAGPERRQVASVAARAAAVEIAIGIAAAAVVAAVVRRFARDPSPLGLALATAGIYGALFLRANELSPLHLAGLLVAAGALVFGLMAGLAARSRPAPAAPFVLLVTALLFARAGPEGAPEPRPRTGGPPDILLVVLDTMRADRVPAAGESGARTPSLARLASEGTRYANAFATSSWTVPTHASLFTGLLPQQHGCDWESPYLPADVPTIAERLRAAGYRTLGFSANPWIAPEFGFDRGFDGFETVDSSRRPLAPWSVRDLPALYARLERAWVYDDAGGFTLASDAARVLARPDGRPTFVFVNLLESHLPYHAPAPFLGPLRASGWSAGELRAIDQSPLRGLAPGSAPSGRELEGLRGLYAAAVGYDDFLVGRLVQALAAAGRLERTAIVVVGDHGENLGDHAPLDHQLGVWDTLLRVPLVIRCPERVPAGRIDERLVSGVDVAPAIAALAGLPGAGDGGPLLGGPGRDAVVFSYGRPGATLDAIRDRLHLDPAPWDRRWAGIRTGRLKYVEGSDGARAAYDTRVDPLERTSLLSPGAAPSPEIAALADLLHEAMPPSGAKRRTADAISEETRRKLRSLGYLH